MNKKQKKQQQGGKTKQRGTTVDTIIFWGGLEGSGENWLLIRGAQNTKTKLGT